MNTSVRNPIDSAQIVSGLAEIARLLESEESRDARVRRVLELLDRLVPYECCALLVGPSKNAHLFTIPDPAATTRAALQSSLSDMLHVMEGNRDIEPSGTGSGHLVLPVIGADRIIGVLQVERNDTYDLQHVQLLSTVASQLGAYWGMVDLRDRERRAQDVINENEQRLRFMAETMPQKIFTAKPDGAVDYFNRQWMEFTGLSFEQIKDWAWTQFIHPDDVEENIRRWKHCVDTGDNFQLEYRFRRKDGIYRWHLSRAQAMRDAEGNVLLWIGSNTDIDDQKRTEETLHENEARLRTLADTLETQVRVRTKELEQRNTEVLRQSEQLRELSHRLIQTQDQERRHIARELHDSAGQVLTALGMNLARVVEHAKRNAPDLAKEAEESQQLVQQLSQEIRTTSYLLHPPLLDEMGLPEALRWYIQGLKERSRLDITLTIADDFGRLSDEMELVIFRLVQECLTNVHRHSGSKKATLRITRETESVSLEVKDEGNGISPQRLREIQSEGSGLGIRGMRERVRRLYGNMNVESNGGTIVSFRFPVPQHRAFKTREYNPNSLGP